MPRFMIVEFDNDYRAYSGTEEREFPDRAAADAYCRAETWTGHTYFVHPIHDHKPSPPVPF